MREVDSPQAKTEGENSLPQSASSADSPLVRGAVLLSYKKYSYLFFSSIIFTQNSKNLSRVGSFPFGASFFHNFCA